MKRRFNKKCLAILFQAIGLHYRHRKIEINQHNDRLVHGECYRKQFASNPVTFHFNQPDFGWNVSMHDMNSLFLDQQIANF